METSAPQPPQPVAAPAYVPAPTPAAPPAPLLPPAPTAAGAPAPPPVYTPPPPDPGVAAADARAQAASIASLQGQAQMDSASILARYGQQLSMANAVPSGSPLLNLR